MFCPRCGTQLPDDAQFCGSCGTRLATPAAPAANVTPVAVSVPITAAAATTPSGGAAAAAPKGVSKRAVAIGLVAVIVIAAVVVAGMLTSWFGLAKDKGAYVVTKQTVYQTGEGLEGVPSFTSDIMTDAHGNAVSSTISYYGWTRSNDGPVETYLSGIQSASSIVDEHGIVTHRDLKTTSEDGSVLQQESIDYENEYDAKGMLTTIRGESVVEATNSSNGDPSRQTRESVYTYDYHANGHVKTIKMNSHLTAENWYSGGIDGSSDDYTSENTSTAEYDENGYVLHTEQTQSNHQGSGDAYSTTVDYAWEFDLAGKPTACTVTLNSTINSDSKKYTFDTDDAGNITAVYDPNGNKTAEYEYKRIDDPSDAVKNLANITIPWSF